MDPFRSGTCALASLLSVSDAQIHMHEKVSTWGLKIFFKVVTCGQSTVISPIIHSQNFPLFCIAVQLLSHVELFATPWNAACQAPLNFTVFWNLLKFMSIESVILSSATPFSFCLRSFPASGSFPLSQFFISGGQSIGASVSVLPMNIRIYFLWDWLVWSSCSPRNSQEFSLTPQFKTINSSAFSFLYSATLVIG